MSDQEDEQQSDQEDEYLDPLKSIDHTIITYALRGHVTDKKSFLKSFKVCYQFKYILNRCKIYIKYVYNSYNKYYTKYILNKY